MIDIENFEKELEVDFKGEHFSVRDNGSIMRHSKKDHRVRKLDNVWTFGRPDKRTGYMLWGEHRVHRIVAFAFHGEPPSTEYVVDHIDTNRRNNRPENLRWLTRLENVLNNSITRARIENICGSVKEFLNNPSVLKSHTRVDPNFEWMRQVSKEEAQITLKRLTDWANDPNRKEPTGRGIGDWIYQEFNANSQKNLLNNRNDYEDNKREFKREPLIIQSLTPNAVQIDWKNPVEFPLCPLNPSEKPLEEYMNNLTVGGVFTKNKLGKSKVKNFGMRNQKELMVLCDISIGFMTDAITKVTYKDGVYYHENMGVFDPGDDPEELFKEILGD